MWKRTNRIRYIVRLTQTLKRWGRKLSPPSDVPPGHVAVIVGSRCTRYTVPATYLNHPVFQKFLEEAEEVYGFDNEGPLAIPCEESVFEEAVRVVGRAGSGRVRGWHEAGIGGMESRPLVSNSGLGERPV